MADLPLSYVAEAGPALYERLGFFWTTLYQDSELLRRLQEARVLNGLQACQDIQTVAAASNRNELRAYRVERRYPLLLDPKSRNKGPVLTIEAAKGYKIGPLSTTKAPRLDGIALGVEPLQRGTVTYKIINPPVAAENGLVLNIFDDTLLAHGVDYMVVRDTLVVREEFDPVTDDDAPTAVIWACDAMVDQDDARAYVGIPLALTDPDPARLVAVGNPLWDVLTHGPTTQAIVNACAAIFNVDERAVHVCTADGGTFISHRGERMDAMPGVQITPAMTVWGIKAPITAAWEECDITYEGGERYTIPLHGDEDDIRLFWSGVAPAGLLAPYVTRTPRCRGDVCGRIVPAQFFLKLGLGGNITQIVVDGGELTETAAMYAARLKELLPAGKIFGIIVRKAFMSEHQMPVANARDLGAETMFGRSLGLPWTASGELRGEACAPIVTAINRCV